MVRDTHNDHVRRINELFADAKRRSSSAEPPKYVDIELINKKCNVHRGLTASQQHQHPQHSHLHSTNPNNNYTNNYLNNRRNSNTSSYNNNNNNNNNIYGTGTTQSNISGVGGPSPLLYSSDDDNKAAENFIKDLQQRQSFSESYHRDKQKKQLHDTLEAITGEKYRKRNVWNSDFGKNIEHPSAFPSLLRSSNATPLPPRQKESIASQVAAEVIEATAAAMRDNPNNDDNYGYTRRSSVNSLKNDSLNGSTTKLKSTTKYPNFGSVNSNLNNRRDSAISLRSIPSSKRNSFDRTDSTYYNGSRAGSVPPSSTAARRGSTSYDSTYGSLPRRRSSIGYDSGSSTQFATLPRKNGIKDTKRFVSTGNLLTRKTSLTSEPRDYVNTWTKLHNSIPTKYRTTTTTTTTKTTSTTPTAKTPKKTHSILRKSISPTAFDNLDSDTSGGDTSRSSLTKENLTRHVRILENTDHDRRRFQNSILEDADDIFREFHNSNSDGKRFSIDSLDLRKNSAIDLIEEDILANLSMNDESTAEETTTTKERKGDTDRPQFVAVTSLDDCQAIRCAEFHPNGKLYAVGSNSKTFRICEYPSLVEIREDHTAYQPIIVYEKQKYHKGSIYCMDWSPDGELIATGSNDKTIKLMRYNDDNKELEGREIELTMHDGTIRDICFIEDTSNKASLLISGGAGDNKIYVTDCGTATPFQALSGHSGHILSLYNWGGAMFVSGSHDKTIRFWDLRTRSCVNTITPSTQPGIRHGSPVAAVCVDPSGRLLVSGHEDSSCVLYDIRGNRPIQCFKPHTADIRSIRFSPSAYYLLTAGYDKKLMLTDLQGDLTLQLPSVTVAHHNDKVISGRWHPTDFSFLSTSADKTCILWALTSKP
ncbi:general transcriptional corepressor trfA-like isoform X2 [Condylostylus longicornis]|uniref:general transcriptional corepressor trfA-like isoform X2 n=1 Tax=Condylostylus longicornis TaxID=2530218 RepID=UPI00244DAF4F|nr:general transcriptional corepressor trfA-like isoform X2 [Condylostylus longicornis]